MRKCFLIAASNLRRAKGQTIAIIALILLASAMLNLWLMLSLDYKRNFDRNHERLNAEHVSLALHCRDREVLDYLAGILEADDRTVQYTMEDALCMPGSFDYNGGQINTEFVILEKEAALNRSVGRVEIVEEGGYTDGIYLPMLYGMDGSISLGERKEITIGSNAVDYEVCGFFNSIMAGSHNCGMSALLLTEELYGELEEKGYAPASTLVSVRIRDREESEAFEAMLKNAVSSHFPEVGTLSNSYELVSSARYISQMICSGVVSAMAFFVAMIALVVIASNVINDIQENMRSLGALKAIGYRSGQIISALLLQFPAVAVLASLAGIALSYWVFPAVNAMMISQTGIPYETHFLVMPFLLTVCAIGGTVALAVWLSSRRIRKIDPVIALRQGIKTHSFKRNKVPLGRTRLPLHLALAMKTAFSGMKQNVTVSITMMVLSLVVVFSGLMVENVIVDMTPFINLIVGEVADSCVNVNVRAEEAFLRMMENEDCVEKVYLYHSMQVNHADQNFILVATMSDDFTKVNNQEVCFQGRFPRYDNEVAIAGKYAGENNLKIGDEITLTVDGQTENYLICGFTQVSNNLGRDCLLTRDGYERMGNLENLSYYCNLAAGTDIDAFHERVSRQLGADVNATINVFYVVNGSASVYVALMELLVAMVLTLGGAVTVFVLYLLVRILLNNKRREYGIMKALGYTTGELILQLAASFMPAAILSAAAGLSICAWIINPLTALFLRGIGIVKCTFTVPAGFITWAGVALLVFTFGMSCLLSLKIRKITPVALLR